MSTPDPIADGVAYRQMLIDLAGDGDPAALQAAAPGQMRALIDEAGDALRQRPEPAEWSVFECVAHVVDAEIVMAARYRWVLAHDEPDLAGYDQDAWIDRLRPAEQDPDRMLALFGALREANVDLWKRTPAAERSRAGLHRERGRETYDEMFRMIAGHDRFHADQARRGLGALRA